MKEALEKTDKVTYYSFLMSLAKHEGINQTIGGFRMSHQEEHKKNGVKKTNSHCFSLSLLLLLFFLSL